MTKSRIALSKINRSVPVRSGSRPSDFHKQRLASSPRRTPRGTPEAAALRTSKLIAFRGASKENLGGTYIFLAPNACARGGAEVVSID
jgi:hypothetical protein